jgi:hypothetical protein
LAERHRVVYAPGSDIGSITVDSEAGDPVDLWLCAQAVDTPKKALLIGRKWINHEILGNGYVFRQTK